MKGSTCPGRKRLRSTMTYWLLYVPLLCCAITSAHAAPLSASMLATLTCMHGPAHSCLHHGKEYRWSPVMRHRNDFSTHC